MDDDVYYRRSTDHGQQWTELIQRITVDSDAQERPDLAVMNNEVHLVWQDNRVNPGPHVFYARSETDGAPGAWTHIGDLTGDATSAGSPALATTPDILHMVWSQFIGTKFEICYKRNAPF